MPQVRIANRQLEYEWHGPSPDRAPTLVFLHEGLGCVAMWRDFPKLLAAQTACGALVYSRAGYGKSDPIELPRPIEFMHEEAFVTLPRLLDALAVREAILIGHSDGGSISLLHIGRTSVLIEEDIGDARAMKTRSNITSTKTLVRGLILEAPHVFVEDHGLKSIRAIAAEYQKGDLKKRLERYHGKNVDLAFRGWNDVWLNQEFSSWNIEPYLPQIHVPVLLIQGEDDQYGTLEQVKAIEVGCPGRVRTVIFKDCGHSPHLDEPNRTLEAMKEFVEEIVNSTPSEGEKRPRNDTAVMKFMDPF